MKFATVLLLGVRGILLGKAALLAEDLALRQQLAVMMNENRRPRLRHRDRLFWVVMLCWFLDWKSWLVIVKPETVVGWHRLGFRIYWRWKSKPSGRPKVDGELRALIR